MDVRVDDRWSYAGLQVIRLENRWLALDVLPALGGKILHLIDKGGDRNVLWRHPRILPHAAPLQSNVDDHFAGGWDDAFPTGDASVNRWGDHLPYLGEIWNLPLSVRVAESGPYRASLVLDGMTPITPARWTRTITITHDAPIITLHTRIENVGYLPFDFVWGSHAALAVDKNMRIDVPASDGEVLDARGHMLGDVGDHYTYPYLHRTKGEPFDVRHVAPPDTGAYALHILSNLNGGWVAATDVARRRGFGIVFDMSFHRFVWQWMVYGGFRGWYHVIVEPWIAGRPALADAVAAGQARVLEPGRVVESCMRGVLYEGVGSVARLDADGVVTE